MEPAIATRSERPKRRTYAHRAKILILAAIASIVLGLVVALGWSVYSIRPRQNVDYFSAANDLVGSVQPEGRNAVPLYIDILQDGFGTELGELGANAAAVRSREYFELLQGEWDDMRHMPAKQMHNRLRKQIPAIREAASYPAFDFVYSNPAPGKLFMTTMDADRPAFELRRLAQILAVDMRRAANTSDWDGFIQNFESLVGIADQQLLGCALIDLHLSIGVLRFGLAEIQRAVFESALPVETIDRLLVQLELAQRDPAAAAPVVEMSRLEQLELAQYVYSSNSLFSLLVVNIVEAGRLASHREVEERINAAFDQASRWWMMPLKTRDVTPNGLGAIAGEPLLEPFEVSSVIERARLQIDLLNVGIQATKALLLLQRHRALTGAWPPSLGDAMDVEDTIDATTAAAFEYAPTPSADGLPITLDWPKPWRERTKLSLIIIREPLPEPEIMFDWP